MKFAPKAMQQLKDLEAESKRQERELEALTAKIAVAEPLANPIDVVSDEYQKWHCSLPPTLASRSETGAAIAGGAAEVANSSVGRRSSLA